MANAKLDRLKERATERSFSIIPMVNSIAFIEAMTIQWNICLVEPCSYYVAVRADRPMISYQDDFMREEGRYRKGHAGIKCTLWIA